MMPFWDLCNSVTFLSNTVQAKTHSFCSLPSPSVALIYIYTFRLTLCFIKAHRGITVAVVLKRAALCYCLCCATIVVFMLIMSLVCRVVKAGALCSTDLLAHASRHTLKL